jgi:sodium-dependent dicarboxylate transporter 2/3/5
MTSSAPVDRPAGTSHSQRVGFWLGLILFAVILFLPTTERMQAAGRAAQREQVKEQLLADAARTGGGSSIDLDQYLAERQAWFESAAQRRARALIPAAAVTALVACWWITVAAPLPATSLLPLVLLPLLGVAEIGHVAVNYANENIFLFMGGFIIALGIERSGLHRRMALRVVAWVGTGQATIILGFMIASAGLSMWISNTATTLMMLPIALAVVGALPWLLEEAPGGKPSGFAPALMLGVAYAASVGGMATPIGTPPNIVLKGQLGELFPDAPEITFSRWIMAMVPVVVVLLVLVWLILTRVMFRMGRVAGRVGRQVIRDRLRALGPMKPAEKWMLAVFAVTALLWIFRTTLHFGAVAIPGWSDLLARVFPERFIAGYTNDATVAMAMGVLLFVIPCGRDEHGGRAFLMDWDTAKRLPWDILLLFGGGFAIAAGFRETGLTVYLSEAFASLSGATPLVLVAVTCLLMTFVTELTSNTATTQIMLPIVAGAAVAGFGTNPLLLMLAATLSASCAFMMPVATPPNAIVFASGHVKMSDMVRTGLVLNFACAAVIALGVYFYASRVLGATVELPAWAH